MLSAENAADQVEIGRLTEQDIVEAEQQAGSIQEPAK